MKSIALIKGREWTKEALILASLVLEEGGKRLVLKSSCLPERFRGISISEAHPDWFLIEVVPEDADGGREFEIMKVRLEDLLLNNDYRLYWCEKREQHYLTLGYFGGGAINVSKAYEMSKKFAEFIEVPLETIVVEEIQSSRRFKRFKVLWSHEEEQIQRTEAEISEDVWVWLTD